LEGRRRARAEAEGRRRREEGEGRGRGMENKTGKKNAQEWVKNFGSGGRGRKRERSRKEKKKLGKAWCPRFPIEVREITNNTPKRSTDGGEREEEEGGGGRGRGRKKIPEALQ
jgi:hypothetical protein